MNTFLDIRVDLQNENIYYNRNKKIGSPYYVKNSIVMSRITIIAKSNYALHLGIALLFYISTSVKKWWFAIAKSVLS